MDVKVYRRSDGSLVTDFSNNPIEIRVDNMSSDLDPYTSSDGTTWRKIGLIPSRDLPANFDQGAFRDGKRVYIYTRHLSYFALLKPKAAQTKLVMSIASAPTIRPAITRNRFAIRVKVTAPAKIRGDLYSPKNLHRFVWRFTRNAGVSIVKLTWPRKVRRTGTYKVVWIAESNGQVTKTALRVRLLGKTLKVVGSSRSKRPEVVLNGNDRLRSDLVRRLSGGRVPMRVTQAAPEATFALASSRNRNVRVIVVDVDMYPLTFIRDMHMIFPTLRIVALSKNGLTLSRARRAGATLALRRSMPSKMIAEAVVKLLAGT
jgi:hypothetical protein